mmetsp:Transcript_15136/g.37209  ORF Transcript_15136/g.37209 Transcript_15136/m.37209 type:complete len:257 (+) Transcript_15136:100-870(+)
MVYPPTFTAPFFSSSSPSRPSCFSPSSSTSSPSSSVDLLPPPAALVKKSVICFNPTGASGVGLPPPSPLVSAPLFSLSFFSASLGLMDQTWSCMKFSRGFLRTWCIRSVYFMVFRFDVFMHAKDPSTRFSRKSSAARVITLHASTEVCFTSLSRRMIRLTRASGSETFVPSPSSPPSPSPSPPSSPPSASTLSACNCTATALDASALSLYACFSSSSSCFHFSPTVLAISPMVGLGLPAATSSDLATARMSPANTK